MKAWQLLDKPEKWTKQFLARRADGMSTAPYGTEATCFCALGALCRCYHDTINERSRAQEKLERSVPGGDITIWNDSSTYEQVIAKLKELDI